MTEPFADLDRLPEAAAGGVLVVARRDAGGRATASHAHRQGQLLGSLHGLITVAAPLGRYLVPATHAVWLPPHCPHAFASHGPFLGFSVYLSERAGAVLPPAPRTVRMSALLREIVARASGWGGPPRTAAEERLAAVAIDEIASLPEQPLGLPMPADPRLRRIADRLLADPAGAGGQAEWAARAAVPARTLSRLFVAETGFSFTAWRQRARALRAIEALARGEAVTTVALDLGYGDVGAFIAMFRRTMGTTPGRYAAAARSCAASPPPP